MKERYNVGRTNEGSFVLNPNLMGTSQTGLDSRLDGQPEIKPARSGYFVINGKFTWVAATLPIQIALARERKAIFQGVKYNQI